MAEQQATGASPTTPTGASNTTEDMQRRIAELERQVRHLQIGMIHILGGENDGVVRISHLHELSDILGVCFDEHAAHIDATRERVDRLERAIQERPTRTETATSSELPPR